MVSYLHDKINGAGDKKRVKGRLPLTGHLLGVCPQWGLCRRQKRKQMLNKGPRRPLLGYRGKAPAPGPQAETNWRLSRIRRIRETANTAAKEALTLVPTCNTEAEDLFPVDFYIGTRLLCCPFFLNREKEAKSARGGSRLPASDVCPLWTPPISSWYMIVGLYSCATASRGRPMVVRSFGTRCGTLPFGHRASIGTAGVSGVVCCRNKPFLFSIHSK